MTLRSRPYFRVDRHTRVVMRCNYAVPLSVVEFAVLEAFRGQPPRYVILSRELVDEVYRGVRDPPAYPYAVLGAAVRHMNQKLGRLRMRFLGTSRRQHSSYRFVVEPWRRTA